MNLFRAAVVCALALVATVCQTTTAKSGSNLVNVEQQTKNTDYEAEVRRLTPMADNGGTLAQLYLGLILKNGLGSVPKDPVRALGYLLKAAESDQWNSLYIVADMYYDEGWGIPQDKFEAFKWASIAAGRGSRSGLSLANKIRRTLSPDQIKKVEVIVDAWSAPVTLIDGRPASHYSVECGVLGFQIREAADFINKVKNEADAEQLETKTGPVKWPGLAVVYPSGEVAFSDIARRHQGLLNIKSNTYCQ